jgi:hypothetical protein
MQLLIRPRHEPRIHIFAKARKAWMAGTSQDKPGHDDHGSV